MDLLNFVPDSDIRTWVGPFYEKKLYLETGKNETTRIIKDLQISPDNSILDIGCGCGRMSIHFLNYLSPTGTYFGLDIYKTLLEFSKKNIQPYFKNSNFYHLNIKSSLYNPNGTINIEETRFPVEDSSFDFVIGISLFTHMTIEQIQIYLTEMKRVVKKNGKIALTYFLLNQNSEEAMKNKSSTLNFNYQVGKFSKSIDKKNPEEALCHNENKIMKIYSELDLEIIDIQYGGWINNNMQNFQDFIISFK